MQLTCVPVTNVDQHAIVKTHEIVNVFLFATTSATSLKKPALQMRRLTTSKCEVAASPDPYETSWHEAAPEDSTVREA